MIIKKTSHPILQKEKIHPQIFPSIFLTDYIEVTQTLPRYVIVTYIDEFKCI